MTTVDYPMEAAERAVFELRRLFEQFGYKKYKMSKFEEYDLYLEYKSFLPSAQILTFSDLSGRLLALKPDVTLSIAKNVPKAPVVPEKVYYNENVYRSPRGSREYREISQVGLEFLGEVDSFSQCEVVFLAYKSLELLSKRFVMTISHMGFVSGLLKSCKLPQTQEEKLLSLIEDKNAHEIRRIGDLFGLSPEKCEAIATLTTLSGSFEKTLPLARQLVCCDAMAEALDVLEKLHESLSMELSEECFTLDFSVVNDLSYYNGLIFQGYIPGVPRAVLSGGRYDKLMERLGKATQALGFAVYIDELERVLGEVEGYDVDVQLVYDKDASPAEVLRVMTELSNGGETVRAQSTEMSALRYRRLVKLEKAGKQNG